MPAVHGPVDVKVRVRPGDKPEYYACVATALPRADGRLELNMIAALADQTDSRTLVLSSTRTAYMKEHGSDFIVIVESPPIVVSCIYVGPVGSSIRSIDTYAYQ